MGSFPNIVRGLASIGPTLSFTNIGGTPLASVTGTATRRGAWRLTFKAVGASDIAVDAVDFHGATKTSRVVAASGVYTDIIAGLTITLSASVAAGNSANVTYTNLFVVNT